MDINEVTCKRINRHPWELSRTNCVLAEIMPYIQTCGRNCDFVNIGAGDMFFDKQILKRMQGHRLHAIDIGYTGEKYKYVKSNNPRISMYERIEDARIDCFDYALMMDSLEYMEDDYEYVRMLRQKVKDGGFIFFTLPAFQFMSSEHDRIVGNLRRYDKKSFSKLVENISGLEIVKMHYFYTSLLIVRLTQKILNVDIDPQHKVTTGWKFSSNSFITSIVKCLLDIDYKINVVMSNIGVRIPGLSLLVICKCVTNKGTGKRFRL